MKVLHEASPAFRTARLKSERLRILIVFVALAAIFLVRTLRTLHYWTSENISLWLVSGALYAAFAIYELVILLAVQNAIRDGRNLSRYTWMLSILIESCLPALGIIFLTSESVEAAYRPIAHPSALLFFLFITLSTLRLSPLVSRLSGVVSAVSYLAAAFYLGWRPAFQSDASLLSPERVVVSFAISYVVIGFVTGVVAGEVRKQVEAALHEAEMKRHVDRLEHDLEVARSIQQSLLPASMPKVRGFDIAAWNQPADQTGGDYYDWQPLPDGKVLIALADVTGHGIGPALLAAVCRAYARANFRVAGTLFNAMREINAAIAPDIGEGRFVTFVAAVCSPGESHVELLSAGHGPLFLYLLRADRFEAMDAQGLPLGISPEMLSEPSVLLDLDHGDLIVLTTDGFFEWADAQGELFGPERLQQSVRASREKSAAEIISSLYHDVIRFSGGTKQMDDLTAIVIKRLSA